MGGIATTATGATFGHDQLDLLAECYRRNGHATLRGALDDASVGRPEAQCVDAQQRLVDGDLEARLGTGNLIENDAGDKAAAFANYVLDMTQLSAEADSIMHGAAVRSVIERCPDRTAGLGRLTATASYTRTPGLGRKAATSASIGTATGSPALIWQCGRRPR